MPEGRNDLPRLLARPYGIVSIGKWLFLGASSLSILYFYFRVNTIAFKLPRSVYIA